jgi:hypothetical protein
MSNNPYKVVSWGAGRWVVVRADDSNPRPVGEHYYTDPANAHRRKRQLNRDAREIDKMIKSDGAIII